LSGKLAEIADGEVLIERPDGSRVRVVVNIRSVKNQLGEVTGAINCFYDITERSRLEKQTRDQAEALADLHRRKDEFLAMLGHELRNPLAPILNAVHLLRLHKKEDPLQQQARAVIERQVGQLTRLVDDMLEVSRITTGRIQLREDRIVVSGIVERAVETVFPLMEQHQHELTVSLPPEPICLYVDAARLEQVLVNLLTNAAKYTRDGGQIWLTVEQLNDECVMRVRDTGIGIPPDLLPRIFDLFTQAERSLDRSQGGLGIGLALVQRLVEMHRGSVEVVSTLGEGSEFSVRLPVVLSTAAQQLPPPTHANPARHSLKVLVVDDNVDTAESLAELLVLAGHEVWKAHTGPAALAAALEHLPNVVLLDIGLPELNGYDVAKRIRQHPGSHNIVLVAMTGYGQATDRIRAQEAGFDHHLVKPADFGLVEQILANVPENAT
jgi:signal transduction histidine kinase/CheY-like chemotaxis protein